MPPTADLSLEGVAGGKAVIPFLERIGSIVDVKDVTKLGHAYKIFHVLTSVFSPSWGEVIYRSFSRVHSAVLRRDTP